MLIETEIVCDFIDLPGSDLTALSGHSFDFPVNPVDGYIDASVYLGGAHNPIDLTRIERAEPRRLLTCAAPRRARPQPSTAGTSAGRDGPKAGSSPGGFDLPALGQAHEDRVDGAGLEVEPPAQIVAVAPARRVVGESEHDRYGLRGWFANFPHELNVDLDGESAKAYGARMACHPLIGRFARPAARADG
jgi:hypothetical protein